MLKTLLAASAATLTAALACAGDNGDDPMTPGPNPTGTTTGTTMPTATNTMPTATTTVPPNGPLSYAKDIEPFILPKCVDGCHSEGLSGGPGAAGLGAALDLSMGVGYTSLQQPSIQVTMPLIGATPEGSFLWLKINDMQDSATALETSEIGVGIRMPWLTPTAAGELTAAEFDLIKRWIEGGAMP